LLHGFLDTHLLIHSWCDIARNRVGAGIGRRQDEDLRGANGRDVKTNALNAVLSFLDRRATEDFSTREKKHPATVVDQGGVAAAQPDPPETSAQADLAGSK